MAELVVKTYSNAIFQLAKEEDALDAIEEEAQVVLKILNENEEFLTLLNHPKISKEDKISILEKTFSEKISANFLGLLVIVVKKDRYSYIVEIIRELLNAIKEEKGIVAAHISSAKNLSDAQKEKVEQRLKELTQKSIEPVYVVESSLIGGLKIRIGDRIVDNSIKGKIDLMAKELRNMQLA
ncbi:F-type H+-transporting ATPase subunit delta [Natranaerovirga hydrolytica]|uniref:ATP synthase subunit delta n=1 Tax=Natranaerovirga hydrolytica TaxID=680378 RepID=A0A4R1MDH8_9FIRM|nr:ATP synthase F1 subunit delta [Natranaerovirga hydrolytica]TCK87903.1 F-type H+-transporting ATPase subunit delta [Natranaerovirga hydrolytica]